MEDQEIIQEFLIESLEGLVRLDQEMVHLEQRPKDQDLLASIFRTIHTIKGTCGFLGFTRLEGLAHVLESLLSELRAGSRELDTPTTSLILEGVDAIRKILASIESGTGEGEVFELELKERLEHALARPAQRSVLDTPPPPQLQEAPAPHPVATAPAEDDSPAASADAGGSKGVAASDTTLRVDIALLDRLMNLVGELVLTRNQVLQCRVASEDSTLNAISQRLNLITTELQEGVMKTRMQPIKVIWNKLPRMVRDLATGLKKEIALEMEGADTELDRAIIEAIKDPLTHLVRNSCDHGIETPEERLRAGKPAGGRLTLRAYHEGGQVNIEITDDGKGVDPKTIKAKAAERGLITADQAQRMSDREAVNLIFLPGFSTAKSITSISGRGVGMDVVRTHIERIGGMVDLISKAGKGTTVKVRIPLTLAIIPGLVIEAGGDRFVIPQVNLNELIRLEGDAIRTRIEYIHDSPVFRRRDMLLPILDLNQVLRITTERPPDEVSMVVVQADDHRFGLLVDAISDTQEIVVKPLGQQLKSVDCYAGATIMGDGGIALILDIVKIADRGGVFDAARQQASRNAANLERAAAEENKNVSLLMMRAGHFERLAMPLEKVARLEKISRSSVERAAGQDVVQYRGAMLPLVWVAEALSGARTADTELIHVVVCRLGASEFGLVVDEILDVAEEALNSTRTSECSGIMGSAIVGGRVTDFLDLNVLASRIAGSPTSSLGRLSESVSGHEYHETVEELVA